MNWENFIQNSGFAAILTALITVATCAITYFQGIKQVKIKKFSEIYQCLNSFSEKKKEVMERCNQLIDKMGQLVPDEMANVVSPGDSAVYREFYHEFNHFLMEYSLYLESLLSFYHFLYKDKSNIFPTKVECWKILELYEKVTEINYDGAEECKIEYVQIVTLVQFIKINSGIWERVRIYQYFNRNKVFNSLLKRILNAFFDIV